MSDNSAPLKKVSAPSKSKRSWRRVLGIFVLVVIVLGVIARLMMPWAVRWYVNRTIDRNPLYDGEIGRVEINLWRGGYSIHDIKLNKTTGNLPAPLFYAKRVDLELEWKSLRSGKVVGKVVMQEPGLNFVDSKDESESQTGAGGPWLQMIRDLFPFKINSATINSGSIHFLAARTDPPVDVYISQLQAQIANLTNIHDDIAPLIATVDATGLAMDHAKLEYHMKLDPFSYRPTFQLAVRLLALDVTKINSLARAYGSFDFERGWFDLVVELNSREGAIDGYVKPLFRNLVVFSLTKDVPEDNVIEVFWEALVGAVTELLKNAPRDQFGTRIPISGEIDKPGADILTTVGNVLRNAFVRAYLPKLRGSTNREISELQFKPGEITDATAPAEGSER